MTRQPFLHDAVVALRAPTQTWSRPSGDMSAAIDGVYHGDRRFLSAVALTVGEAVSEPIAHGIRSAGHVVFDAVLRDLDDPSPDPHVLLTREREVADGRMTETITVASVAPDPVDTRVRVRLVPDFRPLADVKAGAGAAQPWRSAAAEDGMLVTSGAVTLAVTAPDAVCACDDDAVVLTWPLALGPQAAATVTYSVTMADPGLVVRAPVGSAPWRIDDAADPRLTRWVAASLGDLDALRLALPHRPDDAFVAAGAPWFLTLFGRDSLWTARMMLPVDTALAASTLRVLASLQGTEDDPRTEEEPGRIPHELRSGELSLPGEGILLPPLYYGTVDATALWVCLLADAARWGMPEAEVRALLPNLRAALGWITRSAGEAGFLSYVDRTGRGLANQGWKDSGDSIQWRDGTLATGPIALCEVQGYAYEAAVGAGRLLDQLGEPGAHELRRWADALRTRFRDRFWVTTVEGRYPAIALDREGRPVDTLTSNIGHLVGTGILSADEEATVARLLLGESMSSGFGIRTMSAEAAGFWPLGYHAGAVWAHDSAIIARGLARAGLRREAALIVEQLLRAAEAFEYRMPELYGGFAHGAGPDGRPVPVPYPAACRPQAWSAAAAIVCWEISR